MTSPDDPTNLPPPCGEGQARAAGQGGEGAAHDDRGRHHLSIARARGARKNLTLHEAWLWKFLKTLRAQGFHFRRQVPLCGYRIDFLCYSQRLVIELDGGGHMEDAQSRRDAVRDTVLERNGFRVLRIWNGELDADYNAVTLTIMRVLAEPSPPWRAPRACSSPQGGGRR